jgi:hypothetical protein
MQCKLNLLSKLIMGQGLPNLQMEDKLIMSLMKMMKWNNLSFINNREEHISLRENF